MTTWRIDEMRYRKTQRTPRDKNRRVKCLVCDIIILFCFCVVVVMKNSLPWKWLRFDESERKEKKKRRKMRSCAQRIQENGTVGFKGARLHAVWSCNDLNTCRSKTNVITSIRLKDKEHVDFRLLLWHDHTHDMTWYINLGSYREN